MSDMIVSGRRAFLISQRVDVERPAKNEATASGPAINVRRRIGFSMSSFAIFYSILTITLRR